MDISEVTDLHLKTFNTSWDYYIDGNHSIEDLSLEKVRGFIELANQYKDIKITDDPIRVLNKFELIRENKITYGGFLLFMQGNSALTTIELGRFQTPTIIKDSMTLKSDLFSEVEAVMDFIKKHINKSYIITGNVQREEKWDYPLDAVSPPAIFFSKMFKKQVVDFGYRQQLHQDVECDMIHKKCISLGTILCYNNIMKKRKETKGILILKDHSETDEIDFELDYLLSLTTHERFRLMEKKSLEIRQLLEQNGHRRPPEIIKRK